MSRIACLRCDRCIYWVADTPATTGHCHRYPPLVYYNTHGQVAAQKVLTVDHRHWCGEWSDDDARFDDLVARCMKRSARAG